MSQRKVRIKRSNAVQVDLVIEVAEPPPIFEGRVRLRASKRAAAGSQMELYLDVHLLSADAQLSIGEPVAVTLPNGTKLAEPVRQKDLDRDFATSLKRRCWTVPDVGELSIDPVIVIPIVPKGDDVPCPVQICLTYRFGGVNGSYYDPVDLSRVPAGLTFLTG